MWWIRKGLIWFHRYLGIALSLLFVVWFVSGIGMMFAGGMPRLSLQERLQREPAIDLALIKLSPAEAAARATAGDEEEAGSGQATGRRGGGAALRAVLDRPIYRVAGQNVFADDGSILDGIDSAMAMKVASHFMGGIPMDRMQHTLLEEVDQWT